MQKITVFGRWGIGKSTMARCGFRWAGGGVGASVEETCGALLRGAGPSVAAEGARVELEAGCSSTLAGKVSREEDARQALQRTTNNRHAVRASKRRCPTWPIFNLVPKTFGLLKR